MPTLDDTIVQLVKIVAIVFALVHLLAGFVLIRQMSRMNTIIRTQNKGCLTAVSLIYGGFLVIVLLMIILFPV